MGKVVFSWGTWSWHDVNNAARMTNTLNNPPNSDMAKLPLFRPAQTKR